MIIYVEYVILDNYALDLFIALLVCQLCSIKSLRAFVSALFGTITALFYPLLPNGYTFLYKCASFIITISPLFFKCSKKQCFTISISYLIISSVFSGLLSLLIGSNGVYYSNGGSVFIICAISLCLFFIGRLLLIKLLPKGECDYVKVEIDKKVYKGFFDNGNKVIASDGKGVVFLNKNISKLYKNNSVFDYILTQTVNGSEIKEVIIIPSMKIYFKGEEHTYNNVNAIKTNKSFSGFDILLSQSLKEN